MNRAMTGTMGRVIGTSGRVREELLARRESLEGRVSAAYLDRMLAGLQHWVDAGRAHKLAWGILHFRKTA